MPSKSEIACPICSKKSDFFAQPVGPFCSNRCKMVDLGKWLGEEYAISEPLRPDHFLEEELLRESRDEPPPL